jgi:hypothetical protein
MIFSDYVLAGCADPFADSHHTPMAYFVAFTTKIIRWDFVEMAAVIGAPLPLRNKSAPTEAICTEARAAFERVYAADLALWNSDTT